MLPGKFIRKLLIPRWKISMLKTVELFQFLFCQERKKIFEKYGKKLIKRIYKINIKENNFALFV